MPNKNTIMTSKDKAKELVDKFYSKYNNVRKDKLYSQEQKRMALIAVDEIIDAIDWHEFEVPNKEIKYWLDVKLEIIKL